ncbi:hypothetical protein GAP32_172 [Cronobacter phage vB_CsaM_GAP32]|uniref:Putative membrane protein n=1 Tax=Cronobacter phage vB_CsaM_GAP32 TaxID=1141136 RepID=K4F7D1_9CAUD|nr:hypothetical protein GAP32_172 [Cronobacter phage vB_CsaM_GAP32]AFC21622.1 putative membrane protein [Cronobacter phage vB_CsaM_GAP32]
MIIEIIAVLASQLGITGLSLLGYHRWVSPKKEKRPAKELSYQPGELTASQNLGLVVQDLDETVEVITADEHLKRLIKMYPDAAKDYHKHHAEKRLLNRADRYILRMLLAVEAGEMTVKKTSHHIEFSNGDTIWTSNAYYSYGNLDHSPDNPHCRFSCSDGRLSLYTFMRIVHLEETEFEPLLRLKNKTIRVTA